MGKAKNRKHSRRQECENKVPVISVDYTFMGEEEKTDAEEREGKAEESGRERKEIGMPILVMKDRKSKAIYVDVVPEKGRHPHAIKRMAQNIGMFGYNRIIIKSDQERAIMQLKECAKRERREKSILRDSMRKPKRKRQKE